MVKTRESILANYQTQVQLQQTQIENLIKKLNNISLLRLGLFIAEILLITLIISFGYHFIYEILLVLPVLIFMFMVKKQVAVQEELQYARQLLWVYQNEVDVFQFQKNAYHNGSSYENELHPYSSDLDIFGPSSLYAYINRCSTVRGQDLLSQHFSKPNALKHISDRQEAIKELMGHLDDSFHFRAKLHNHKPEQLLAIENAFQHHLYGQLEFARKKLLRTYVMLVPFITIAGLIAGIVYGGLVWNVFGLIALFNAAVTFFHLKKIGVVYDGFSGSAGLLKAFSGTIEWIEKVKWQSKYIQELFSNAPANVPVSRQIKQLSSIIQGFDARLNMILSLVLNLFFLWDLKYSIKLEKWYAASSDQLLKGLQRISDFEELISFATLTYNEPDWNFPEVIETFSYSAEALGHPLISKEKRVVNDFNLELQPTVDIVTGSNMAGKSTFLRTVGINMILAFSGAPVCAKRLRLSIFEILSYMRIKDSLNDQTSTFKAELNRLKMILDATRNSAASFVLIDEMLRGTNSKDKYLGSKVFIQKMIEQQTPTLFATHDLQLSEMKNTYTDEVRNYHFDIQITDAEMQFDYKLKFGACKTFNAAILLKQIGLSLPLTDA
jgi:DNA mismatch repair ATPase MutS